MRLGPCAPPHASQYQHVHSRRHRGRPPGTSAPCARTCAPPLHAAATEALDNVRVKVRRDPVADVAAKDLTWARAALSGRAVAEQWRQGLDKGLDQAGRRLLRQPPGVLDALPRELGVTLDTHPEDVAARLEDVLERGLLVREVPAVGEQVSSSICWLCCVPRRSLTAPIKGLQESKRMPSALASRRR